METTARNSFPAPVDTTERAVILDVIRGFALSGVFLSNVYIWMSGLVFVPREAAKEAMSGTLWSVIGAMYGIFISGKFMTMFTFLFGIGLSVQFARAAERNDSATKRYIRRCMALVFLGVLHMLLLWYGDITHQYALIGLFVLLFRKRSTKTILVWGLVLALLAVPVGMWSEFVLPKILHSSDAAKTGLEAQMARDDEFNRQALATFRGHSYLAILRMNLAMYWHQFVSPVILAYDFSNLGNFLLGLAVGRLGWFQDVSAHRKAFKRLLGWSALVAVVSFAITAGMRAIWGKQGKGTEPLAIEIIMPILRTIMTEGLAVVYMSAIALLYQRDFFRRFFSIFAPAGRMAVSNYFGQSAIGLVVFCGIGLGHMGEVLVRWMIVMPIVMYSMQMIVSWLWLRHFRFGPVEWISRSLTYGKLQSMR